MPAGEPELVAPGGIADDPARRLGRRQWDDLVLLRDRDEDVAACPGEVDLAAVQPHPPGHQHVAPHEVGDDLAQRGPGERHLLAHHCAIACHASTKSSFQRFSRSVACLAISVVGAYIRNPL